MDRSVLNLRSFVNVKSFNQYKEYNRKTLFSLVNKWKSIKDLLTVKDDKIDKGTLDKTFFSQIFTLL